MTAALSAPAPDIENVVLPRLRRALSERTEHFVLVVDDVHLITSKQSNELLRAVVEALPSGSQLALGSRTEPGLPFGRLRANRDLVEMAQRELALTDAEAAALLENIGLRLKPAQVAVIQERTEGWPAATYLAGLSLADQPDIAVAVSSFAGDDRFIVDYLRDEFLATTSGARMRFLTRSSLLDELSGPICDSVLDRNGSARVLRELSRANSLIVPLDRNDSTYRYHHLFAELLAAELRRREPDLEPTLHRRASEWYAEHGDPVRAIDHAIAAEDPARAGQLIWQAFPELTGRGRMATIRNWLDLLGEERVKATSALGLTEAHYHLILGAADKGAHWARQAEAAAEAEPGGRDAVAADLHLLDATFGLSGGSKMEEEAALASELHSPESAWQAPNHLYRGLASHVTGHPERAKPMLREAVRRGAVSTPIIETLALVQLALIAFEDNDSTEALRLTAQAREQVERCGMRDYGSMLEIYACSAMVLASEGRVGEAERDANHAAMLLTAVTGLPLWYEVQARIVLARAFIRLGKSAGRAGPARRRHRIRRDDPRRRGARGLARGGRGLARERGSGRGRGGLATHQRGAADAPVSAEPPLLQGDRRGDPRLAQHHQDPGPGGLSQARRELAGRGGGAGPRGRPRLRHRRARELTVHPIRVMPGRGPLHSLGFTELPGKEMP